MRWRGRRESVHVEDRRGKRLPMGRGLPRGRAVPIGCGGLVLLIALAFVTGQDPLQLLQVLEDTPSTSLPDATGIPGGGPAPGDELGRFAAVVLADTEETWHTLFAGMGRPYREPTLVLFSDATRSACGFGNAAVGPFYCPADQKVYLDLSFFRQLERSFGAPGDFAQAYVVAHEIGHHVQNLLGISGEIQRLRRQVSRTEANSLSVRLELQADCLAGVWGHHAHRERNLLEPGDVEEGLGAAAAIGDDRMQRRATGTVQPESWTHGSSDQRVTWLRRGLETGDPAACDTFGTGR